MDAKRPRPRLYMNVNTRAVYFAKPQHADNPKMAPFYGKLPPVDKRTGLCTVPRENLGPEFALEEDEEVKVLDQPVKEVEEKEEVEDLSNAVIANDMEKIVDAIGDLKAFDFTSAGIPKVDKLSLACGFQVTGKERDEAFALHMERKSLEG